MRASRACVRKYTCTDRLNFSLDAPRRTTFTLVFAESTYYYRCYYIQTRAADTRARASFGGASEALTDEQADEVDDDLPEHEPGAPVHPGAVPGAALGPRGYTGESVTGGGCVSTVRNARRNDNDNNDNSATRSRARTRECAQDSAAAARRLAS